MPHVKLTRHLQQYFPALGEVDVEAAIIAEVVAALDRQPVRVG